MNIEFKNKDYGISINFKKKKYNIILPKDTWNILSHDFKEFFIDNFAMLKSVHIPLMFGDKVVHINRRKPKLMDYFIEMQLADIPGMYYLREKSSKEELNFVKNAEFNFEKGKIRLEKLNASEKEDSIISFSYGKDSLMSLALSAELGIKQRLIGFDEKGAEIEIRYKKRLDKKLKKEFGFEVERIRNDSMPLHSFRNFRIKNSHDYSLGHLMTEYVFLTIPFANKYSAKYIILGNERSCNDYVLDKYNNKCYPSFDQSADWMLKTNKMLGKFSNIRTVSLVGPLGDLAILKVLYERYPTIAKYQYSCFPDESAKIENERWCCNCSKCARLFIMFKAIGEDVKKIGFTKNMLEKESKNYYSIFAEKSNNTLYDDIGVGKSEQIYAFYLACKKGAKGWLIDEFKRKYMVLAKEKEEEWFKEFFGIHESRTMPRNINLKVKSIYKEVLK